MFRCGLGGRGFGGFGFHGNGLGMWITHILFWGLLIFAIVYLIKSFKNSGRNQSTGISNSSGALEILKMKYAKGEINKNEFEEKKKDLGY
jgi:putative membrane protein